jgi:hypothetical protein
MWPQPSGPSSRGFGMVLSTVRQKIPLIPAQSASKTRVNALMAGIQG